MIAPVERTRLADSLEADYYMYKYFMQLVRLIFSDALAYLGLKDG